MTVRMRHTRSHTNNRRSHHSLARPALAKDEAGNAVLRHRLSPKTGSYRGRKVIDAAAQIEKRMANRKKKEETR